MTNIDFIDTVKIDECGKEILNYTIMYNEIMKQLYTKLNNMPTKTYEWVGNGANQYVEKINSDYKFFDDLNNILKQYGNFLIDTATCFDETIKKN